MDRKTKAFRHSAKIVRQHFWGYWARVRLGANERSLGLAHPEHKKAFGLLTPQPAQLVDGKARERDGSRAIGLWRLKPQPTLGLLQAFYDADYASIEIEIAPAQSQNFAAAHSGGECDQDRPIKGRGADCVE